MNKNNNRLFLIIVAYIVLTPYFTFTNNTKLYISAMSKLAQKKDFNATLESIATVINETQDEKIDTETMKAFTESEQGKQLASSFSHAFNNNVFQIPLTTTGLFLYDFYQSNIFGPHTKTIGKAFEQYLFNARNIPSKKSFAEIKTAKDFVKRHRDLHTQSSITLTHEAIKKSIELIQQATLDQLQDLNYLEQTLLPALGFDGKKNHEFPQELHKFGGQGIESWQYPIQLAKLLVSLSHHMVDTYLEIGTQHGATFIIISEYLKRFNPELKSYAIDPHYYLMLDIYVNEINPNAEYILDFANSKRFIDITSMNWSVAALDGDPSFEGTTKTYNLIKKTSDSIIINDIASDLCPGVISLWNILKKIYGKTSVVEEFCDQYEEVTQRQNKKYLGIGVIYKNLKQ